jgi:hypothetical protein
MYPEASTSDTSWKHPCLHLKRCFGWAIGHPRLVKLTKTKRDFSHIDEAENKEEDCRSLACETVEHLISHTGVYVVVFIFIASSDNGKKKPRQDSKSLVNSIREQSSRTNDVGWTMSIQIVVHNLTLS